MHGFHRTETVCSAVSGALIAKEMDFCNSFYRVREWGLGV